MRILCPEAKMCNNLTSNGHSNVSSCFQWLALISSFFIICFFLIFFLFLHGFETLDTQHTVLTWIINVLFRISVFKSPIEFILMINFYNWFYFCTVFFFLLQNHITYTPKYWSLFRLKYPFSIRNRKNWSKNLKLN